MMFLTKTGVALRLSAVTFLLASAGCANSSNNSYTSFREEKKGMASELLPACIINAPHSNCGIWEAWFGSPLYPGDLAMYMSRHYEVGSDGVRNGLLTYWESTGTKYTECYEAGVLVSRSNDKNGPSAPEVRKICEPIRTAMVKARKDEYEYRNASPKRKAELRAEACDSFGFELGTETHAECAIKLYMNEQNQGVAEAVTSSNTRQTAALARQQAIQDATLKEQKRIEKQEVSLRMKQIGIDLMNGTKSSNTPSKTHTQAYSINGQIIRCTTTGSITTCL